MNEGTFQGRTQATPWSVDLIDDGFALTQSPSTISGVVFSNTDWEGKGKQRCLQSNLNARFSFLYSCLTPFRLSQILEYLTHSFMTWQVFFPGGSDGKASAFNAGDPGSIPGLRRSPGEGNGNPLQYSCLESSMHGGTWWTTVHGVAKSWTLLSNFTFHFQIS